MLTRKTRLVLATLTGVLMATACGSNGYGTAAPPPPPPPPPPPGNTGAPTPAPAVPPTPLNRERGGARAVPLGSGARKRVFYPPDGAPGRTARPDTHMSRP